MGSRLTSRWLKKSAHVMQASKLNLGGKEIPLHTVNKNKYMKAKFK
jgi:hypothetical protein